MRSYDYENNNKKRQKPKIQLEKVRRKCRNHLKDQKDFSKVIY